MTTKRGEKMVVRIDEDERECLRRLGESTPLLPHQSIRPTNSKRTKNQRGQKQPLETKKSEDINESAENFIQKFRQQLLLQRLESLENYDKMLARGL